MTSLKPLKSVAHNLAHHFASTLNYWVDDYAINHVWNNSKENNVTEVKLDILNSRIIPDKLNYGKAKEVLPGALDFLNNLMKTQGLEDVELSECVIEYDFGVNRISLYDIPVYNCVSRIKTTSGRQYESQLNEENK